MPFSGLTHPFCLRLLSSLAYNGAAAEKGGNRGHKVPFPSSFPPYKNNNSATHFIYL